MTEVLTESFCERCGTRYELAPAQRSRAPGGLKQAKVFARGLTKYVLSDAALDEAFTGARREDELTRADAQLQVFHRTFSFCLECRQYTCPQCWNEVQSLCLTCAPMPERADSDPLALLEESADPGPGPAPPPREIVGASAWPMIDLVVANNPFPSPGESPQPIQALPFEPVFEPVFEPLRPDPEGIVALFIEPEHEQHADLHLVPAATDDPAPTEDSAFTDDRVEMSAQADPAPADALASADGLARTDDLALAGFAVAGDPARIVAASDPTDDFAPVADPADNLVPVAELTVEAEPIADTPSNGNGRLIALRDWIERVSRRPTGAPTAAEATSADSGADRQPAVALADEPVAAGELADETVAVPVMPAGGRPRPVRKRVRPSTRRARTVSMQTAPEPVVEPALELAPEPVVEPALELA
ncbi:MAG: hypothetical protein H0V12_03885, partial [Chloroflexi bacterium]|nr:hypothetical protein [Chloroflexota bacterium]